VQWLGGLLSLGSWGGANEPELVLLDHGLYRTLTPRSDTTTLACGR